MHARAKRSKLLMRLVNADANRHQGLTQIKHKAQLDLQGVGEIRLMKTLQETNLQLDIKNKMDDTT